MARTLTLAAMQASYGDDLDANIAQDRGSDPRGRAPPGAQVILPPELFQGPYFCVRAGGALVRPRPSLARASRASPRWRRWPPSSAWCMPISIFEREGPHYFNSLVMARRRRRAARRSIARATSPTGRATRRSTTSGPATPAFGSGTRASGASASASAGTSGIPEAARAMTLMGAEALLYPTAIGSEPHDPTLDTAAPWRRAMQGHAVSNVIPVVGANRTGFEPWDGYPGGGQRFYGSSFISDHRGDLVAELGRDDEGVIVRDLRPRLPRRPPRRLGLLPRPPPGPLRRADRPEPGVIETARLILRPWIDADLEQFVALVTDPAVGEWLGGARSREQALGDFDGMRAFWNVHGNGWLAAVRKDDCAVIGRVACRRLPAEWRHPMGRVVELGWALLPRHLGPRLCERSRGGDVELGVWRSRDAHNLCLDGGGQCEVPGRHAPHRHGARARVRLRPSRPGRRRPLTPSRRVLGATPSIGRMRGRLVGVEAALRADVRGFAHRLQLLARRVHVGAELGAPVLGGHQHRTVVAPSLDVGQVVDAADDAAFADGAGAHHDVGRPVGRELGQDQAPGPAERRVAGRIGRVLGQAFRLRLAVGASGASA